MEKLNYIELFKVPKFQGGGESAFSTLSKRQQRRVRNQANKAGFQINPNTGDIINGGTEEQQNTLNSLITEGANKDAQREAKLDAVGDSITGGLADAIGVDISNAEDMFSGENAQLKALATGAAGKALDEGMKIASALTTGDKNFSASSQAVDAAVGGVTSKLMASKNPYAMLAAGAITTVNELTKMGGQSVPGFEVDISSSGYGDIGQMKESSSRGFFAPTKQDKKRLNNRNEKAALALAAASISDDQSFQQEARMNASQNVIQNNQQALNGGISTDLLAAKHGAKINKVQEPLVKWLISQILNDSIESAKNGTKLKKVEISEEENVIPTGTLHKNKHNLDLEEVTKKGIPVIQNIDDTVETFEEIKEHEDEIVQSAEIESLEIIFNKELTDFIEERMDKSSDREICKEVGMRICKEILFNTKDKSDLIETLNQKENELVSEMD